MDNVAKTSGAAITDRVKAVWIVTMTLAVALVGTCEAAKNSSVVPYPKGFRGWTHVSTVLVGPQSPFFKISGGMIHVYANRKAMQGYAGGHFPDGSMLVFDLLDVQEKDGVTSGGARQRIDVMCKNSKQFSSSGGWGFERFLADSHTDRPLTEEHRKECFTCHQQAKAHDFVFSQFRE